VKALRSLAAGLAHSGLPSVAWQVRRHRAGRAIVLMYHRIADDDDDLCVPPATFDRQMELLKARVRVLPLGAIVRRLASVLPLTTDIAAVTFDDGYRDNLDLALPILERHGLPATVFVTTGFVDGTRRPAGERLRAAVTALRVCGGGAGAWPERDATDRLVRAALAERDVRRCIATLHTHLKRVPAAHSERVLDEIERLAGSPPSANRMLDWEAVRCLARRGVEIASHTITHPILSRVSLERAEHELCESKRRLEAEIGQPVSGFAFPNGQAGDFTADHITILQRLGYAYACTAQRGVNRPGSHPFSLRRLGIGADSGALLDLKLAIGGRVQAPQFSAY